MEHDPSFFSHTIAADNFLSLWQYTMSSILSEIIMLFEEQMKESRLSFSSFA